MSSTGMTIINITEETLGTYQVECKIANYGTTVNLTLSLGKLKTEADPGFHLGGAKDHVRTRTS